MGANVQVDGQVAVFEGVEKLSPAPLRASDLRAGAAMVVAALMADGTSEIEEIGHIERGYENIVEKLRGLGADIRKVERMPACGVPSPLPRGRHWQSVRSLRFYDCAADGGVLFVEVYHV